MLSGLKFIPRDRIDEEQDGKSADSRKETRKSRRRKEKLGRKKKHSRNSSSDEDLERIKSKSKKKKKWYDSNEDVSSFSSGSSSESESECDRKRHRSGKREKSKRDASQSQSSNNALREEMGLGWMLRPKDNSDGISNKSPLIEPEKEEVSAKEIKKDNPRELNPYFKNDGTGYPEESDEMKVKQNRHVSTAAVGDGGASWRLKALKRAQEQAAREGRNLQEVVGERWGSMGHLAASVASRDVAPTHAHLHATKNRRKGLMKEEQKSVDEEKNSSDKDNSEKSRMDIPTRHPKMKMPRVHDSLSWGKRGSKLSTEDTALVSSAMANLNRFSDDGNFMAKFMNKEEKDRDQSISSNSEARAESTSVDFPSSENKEDDGALKPPLSANQLAAKVLQLRMKGKHDEAEKLLKDAEKFKEKQNAESSRPQIDGTTSRFIMHDVSAKQKRKEDDGDLHLARKISQNHRYSVSGQADEEYDYDDGPRKKTRKKGGDDGRKSSEITHSANRILTQQQRCQSCFDNPARPKHLVIAIANFTYLSLPHHQPVVPGHCCILTLQHESSTRTVDDNVWDEIRNFKKCLIMMFGEQEKELVFIETVMGLQQQRRHCLVECIPLPRDIAKDAPLYFKKAIDEAEDEWSQHNAKKLIDTSEKGLRSSIPKNFPYFHVEFGLKRGFVHVIDDEKEFKSSFGLNVIRGMLELPAEDMHRRRQHETVEKQKQAVASFAKEWAPFDWTKQL